MLSSYSARKHYLCGWEWRWSCAALTGLADMGSIPTPSNVVIDVRCHFLVHSDSSILVSISNHSPKRCHVENECYCFASALLSCL